MSVEKYVKGKFDEYVGGSDWRVKENSNSFYSFGALNKYMVGKDSALIWKDYYDKHDKRIMEAHNLCDAHNHDLGSLSSYCFGASLKDLLLMGIQGVPNISVSSPAKRLRTVTSQIANLMTVFQNETAGAIAYSSWNVYLAPFVYFDKLERDKELVELGLKIEYSSNPYESKIDLDYTKLDLKDITESVQNMIFALNSNSRGGAEPSFSNLTLDFKVLKPMEDLNVIIEGKEIEGFTYKDFQKESDMLIEVFSKIMYKGDGNGNAMSYPIPTFNIGKNMDWDNPSYEYVWEMSAKFGLPYFGNFIHGNLNEEDIYSMCCRLRLSKRELINKTGGLFGAGEKTGSLGVWTINLPNIAFRSKGMSKSVFFNDLSNQMDIGKNALILKKKYIKDLFDGGLYPALKKYLVSLDTLFLTIGLLGAHEMCLNYLGKGIDTQEGRDFTLEVLNFMKDKLSDFQEETGELFNLEATPAEGATYRLAKKSKERYPNIITAGKNEVYFTNSVHLPVGIEWSYNDIYKHQHGLLSAFTGGSVYHNYLKEQLTGNIVKQQIKAIFENYDIPYISNSPLYSICEEHGYINGGKTTCPVCGKPTEMYQRVTGYVRRVSNFNKGKHEEFVERNQKECDIFDN